MGKEGRVALVILTISYIFPRTGEWMKQYSIFYILYIYKYINAKALSSSSMSWIYSLFLVRMLTKKEYSIT